MPDLTSLTSLTNLADLTDRADLKKIMLDSTEMRIWWKDQLGSARL